MRASTSTAVTALLDLHAARGEVIDERPKQAGEGGVGGDGE